MSVLNSAILSLSVGRSVTPKELSALLEENGVAASNASINQALSKLVKDDKMFKLCRGVYTSKAKKRTPLARLSIQRALRGQEMTSTQLAAEMERKGMTVPKHLNVYLCAMAKEGHVTKVRRGVYTT